MPHATHPSPGLQALILCGPGISLNTFTSKPSDFPKALVPIANRPMVWYALEWCYRMGITDITLITPPEAAPPLQAALSTNPALTSLPNPKPEILAPEGLDMTTGTAELLRLSEVRKVLERDFVVLPCDLVSEMEGAKFLQQWMVLNPSQSSPKKNSKGKGGLAVYYPTFGREGVSNKKDETDFVATVPIARPTVPPPQGSLRGEVEEVVLAMPTDTVNDIVKENKSTLPIRHALLRKHGRAKIKTQHRDAHIYFFPLWVKDFVEPNEKFESIGEDVVGWWAKAGWQSGLAEKLGLGEVLGEKAVTEDGGEESFSQDDEEDVDAMALSSTNAAAPQYQDITTALSFASRVGDDTILPKTPNPQRPQLPPLLAYIQPSPPPLPASTGTTPNNQNTSTPTISSLPLIRRIDTTPQLLSLSLYLARQTPPHPYAPEHKSHPTAQIGQQSRISQEDCLIAENVTMGMRCNLKETIVGANCEIGANVRLTKCVLMDGVTVGDGVVMTGCVVGRRAKVEGLKSAVSASASEPPPPAGAGADGTATAAQEGKGKGKKKVSTGDDEDEKTRLTDCEIAPYFVVEAGTEAKGETLKGFDDEDDGLGDEGGVDDEEEEDDS
ncbi:Translation initiation factor eIF-2B subunit gamma [Recurvomyces mirabilis]|uniref:Mannose-1-phosphate guanyltransferase n=1 Tax=Recurvomyces mirabilis TaxID=574656 RepID=A0AAE0WT00_9PEZI|nr:Translation initiation factor eIF-2B subunit gamma [Recurvomyces mirabilis]KAK5157335.1 Translation initiation factor eIF-2B subunit gamma [Recurvomyces mirabilis]